MERGFTDGEIKLLKGVFGDSINYKTVVINDNGGKLDPGAAQFKGVRDILFSELSH